MEIKLTGVEKLVKDIDKFVNGVNNDLKAIIEKGTIDIERQAKINTTPNVDTGRLRSSIHHSFNNDLVNGYTGRVGTDVEYAPYLEYGTRRNKKYPYLYPAYDLHKNRIANKIADVVNQRIGK